MILYSMLESQLKKEQSHQRFYHSQMVAKLAGELAQRHGWDPEKAQLAGLLHDWVKEWTPKELLRYVKKHDLDVPHLDFIRKVSPNMVHAYVGADFVRRQGWARDASILRAIASHTLGSLKMTAPEKIVYVADLASYDRKFPEVAAIREEAMADLHKGFASAIALKMDYQLRKRKPIHPLAVQVWNNVVCKVKA